MVLVDGGSAALTGGGGDQPHWCSNVFCSLFFIAMAVLCVLIACVAFRELVRRRRKRAPQNSLTSNRVPARARTVPTMVTASSASTTIFHVPEVVDISKSALHGPDSPDVSTWLDRRQQDAKDGGGWNSSISVQQNPFFNLSPAPKMGFKEESDDAMDLHTRI